jgi:hypothetical protein
MNRRELLEGFAGMSAADRAAVRAEIIRSARCEGAPGVGSAMATTIALMERIKIGQDPIQACHEMLDEMAAMCTD